MKEIKEEYKPNGKNRQYVLDKAVKYILDNNPKLGTQNMKHMFLVEKVGLTQEEYLECLNKATSVNWKEVKEENETDTIKK